MISLLWFFWRVACPLAWWLLSWRGWRRGWCPRRVKRGKPQQPPGERGQQMTGISSLPWTLGRSLLRVSGMGAFWWGVQLIFGIFWFLWERQFLICICVASSFLQLLMCSVNFTPPLPRGEGGSKIYGTVDAVFLADFCPMCFLGAFPPTFFLAVCLVLAILIEYFFN